MNCNLCKYGTSGVDDGDQIRIRYVYGNAFKLGIPLLKRIVTFTDGIRSQTDDPLSPLLSDAPITVVFGKNGAIRYEYQARLEGGYVVVEDKGKLPVGTYSITVLATDVNGDPLRYKENLVLSIVDATADANYDGLTQYDGYFKFPMLAFGGGSFGNMWERDVMWVRESPWNRN